MLHGLLLILLLVLAAVLVVAMIAVRLLSGGIRMVRDAAKAAAEAATGSRHTAGSHRREHTAGRQDGHTAGRCHTTASGETVIDSRDPQTADRRIFADNEGEYVDFEEER